MKICFLGTPEFAVPILEELIKNHEVTSVITQPDRAKNRGKRIVYSPIKNLALEYNINIYQPEKIKNTSFIKKLHNINADIFIVVAYGQILSKEILDIPKYGCINVHASLLPKYRGAAPIQWAIINGEKKTGITIMQMDEGLDTGDILLKKEIDILLEDTSETLHNKLSLLGREAILETLNKLENNNIIPKKQDNSQSTYAPILKKELGHIDWKNSNKNIINLIRGLNPWPGTYTNIYNKDNILKIWKAKEYFFNEDITGICGEILENDPKIGLIVKTSDGAILLEEIQIKNGKRMNSQNFLRGHNIKKGTILF